ncbi:MAG: YolD-like family protein, partial [Acetatifactor sp.]|nr:YolD-like family protein [Acetatifactor sp.]
TGHDAAIRETARLTDTFVELDEGRKQELDEQLQLIKENQSQKPEIEVTYFQPDLKKSGGAYMTFRGRVKKIDEYNHRILFTDGTVLSMETLFFIGGELFNGNIGDM